MEGIGRNEREEGTHCKIDAEDTHSRATDSDRGDDPMDMRERGPSEPEESNGQESRFHASEVKSAFRRLEPLSAPAGDFLLVDA